MRTPIIFLSCLLASLSVLVSCGSHHDTLRLDISLRNDTATPLDWVELKWDGPYVPGGILSPGIVSTSVDVSPPKSDVATITFVEKTSRKQHKITLDVSGFKSLHSGKYDAVLAITSLDGANLIIHAEQ